MIGSLSPDEIEDVLTSEVLGRVAFISEGRPHIAPVTYVYDSEVAFAYIHSADGHKVRAMRATPEVCFEVEQIKDMANWRTVIAHGRFQELAPDREERAMALLTSRLTPMRVSETASRDRQEAAHRQSGVVRNILYRLHLTEKSGRFEQT